MVTILESLRTVLGVPQFYSNGVLDLGLCVEYLVGGLILLTVVVSVFKLVRVLFK